MRLKVYFLVSLLLSLLLPGVSPAKATDQPGIDTALAAEYFQEAAELARRDAGKLWGISLAGPMLFVEKDSRIVVANEADPAGKLQRQGEVFTGRLPDEVNIANTATNWEGVKWTMIIWPLPAERSDRWRLMAHELFHRIQDRIRLASPEVSNGHLDSQEGRTWLRLEWRALERALQEQGAARRQAIADAIYFRRYRQSLFPNGAVEECALESNEGLAEYTGLKLSAHSARELAALAGYGLRRARLNQTFNRSFAYASGPAYGALLDAAGIRWRREFKSGDDLSSPLERGLAGKLGAVSKAGALARAKGYDGDEVIAAETHREAIRVSQSARYRARFLEAPVLVINVASSFNYSYDPGNLVPLDGIGTVYPTMRVTDDWGILEVSDGALLIREGAGFKKLHVAAPTDPQARPLIGPGWKLAVNAGWTISPGERSGDFVVHRQK